MKLSVVIVNYRTPLMVVDAVGSLVDDPSLPSGTRIVVVDGGSGDDSAQVLAREIAARGWAGQVDLLALTENRGFAYANNRGIEHLRAAGHAPEYFLLLNPDTVCRPGAASALTSFLDAHPAAGIAGSRLEDMDGTPQACAFRFPNPIGEFESEIRLGPVSKLLRQWSNLAPVSNEPTEVEWVSGASFMVRASMVDQLGLMNEDYFLYYEEVDYCLKAARAGWQCWYVPASRVVHLVGQSTKVTRRNEELPRRPAYWFESRRRYFLTNHGRFYTFMADLAWMAGFGLRRIRRPLRKDTHVPPHLFGDFVRHSVIVQGRNIPMVSG
ncbi:glycosyltransferase family 2 protein [Aureimonas fodinaquatilis]|uniref:Glycosyltransferase family 2 protein n=1 Tax=Aureimonas fodinaquatilis TaxID=2565783 RepID=A0A5B0DZD6_9HYPH|nr:glycosyltransferase family 2 protein [Aureimonas fodinaquatilis]KAA0970569.1 glycosyltransferase family 2 protein [Aureimonas fodinaquatilis]